MGDTDSLALRSSTRLDGLPSYGRNRAILPDNDVIRLGSNECPAPPSKRVLEAAVTALSDVNRYPDLRGESLSDALAERYSIPFDHVAVSAGSVVLLELLIRAYCDAADEVVTPWRSYEAYPLIVQAQGAVLVEVPLGPKQGIDVDGVISAITDRTRVVLICNPNNPTGTAVNKSEIDRLIEAVPSNVLVILDEAYAEFNPGAMLMTPALFASYPNVVILRTFSKAYGLAGLRVGYCLANPAIIAAVQAIQPPFPLPSPALAAARVALTEVADLEGRVASNARERDRLTEELRANGLPVATSCANFVWLPIGAQSQACSDAMRQDGIAVRCFPGEGVRITIGTASETGRVIDTISRWHTA